MKFPKSLVLAVLPLLVTTLLDAATEPSHEIEIKLFVSPKNTAPALKSLDLDPDASDAQDVCFFDTADRALAAHDLIFRVRQGSAKAGDAIVKIRTMPDSPELTDAELAIPAEQDWTDGSQPVISRTLKSKLSRKGLLADVVAGKVPAGDLLSDKQKELITRRLPGFKFDSLKRYGPVKTEVWKNHLKFKGFPEPVTVELWQLQENDRSENLLEVSSKASAGSDAQARDQAKQFFAAAKSAGMGTPTPQTKTSKVFEFHKPGR